MNNMSSIPILIFFKFISVINGDSTGSKQKNCFDFREPKRSLCVCHPKAIYIRVEKLI